MGMLEDTVEEVKKLPPAARFLVLGGAAGGAILLYLHARANGSSSSVSSTAPTDPNGSSIALPLDPGYGQFTIPGGPPSSTTGSTSSSGGSSSPGGSKPPTTKPPTTKPPTTKPPVVHQPGSTAPKTYTVKAGDTLGNIAYKYHISGGATALYNYGNNRRVIGGNINLIRPGQVLQLPG